MNSPKKILILASDLSGPGGVSNYYSSLNLQSEANIDYFPVNTAKPTSAPVTALRLITNYFRFVFFLITKGYNIIHVNPSLDRNSFYRDAVFIFLAHLLGKKTIIFFRGWEDEYENKIKSSSFKKTLFKFSYAKGSKFIVLSKKFKEKLLTMGVPKETPFYIETTVADSKYLPDLKILNKFREFDNEIRILFLSRIEKEKGVYIAIEAFDQFQKINNGIKTRLVIAGDGPELPAVKKFTEDTNIKNVFFTGYVRGDQKKELLLNSHIMLFPTYYGEGLPNSILESMLYAMPVISRDNAGISDVVENNVNGYITESKEPSVFADYLTKISTDSTLYKNMANTNHDVARSRFTSEKVRERVLSIYETFSN